MIFPRSLSDVVHVVDRFGESGLVVIAFMKLITNEITKASTLTDVATIPHANPAIAILRPRICTRKLNRTTSRAKLALIAQAGKYLIRLKGRNELK